MAELFHFYMKPESTLHLSTGRVFRCLFLRELGLSYFCQVQPLIKATITHGTVNMPQGWYNFAINDMHLCRYLLQFSQQGIPFLWISVFLWRQNLKKKKIRSFCSNKEENKKNKDFPPPPTILVSWNMRTEAPLDSLLQRKHRLREVRLSKVM